MLDRITNPREKLRTEIVGREAAAAALGKASRAANSAKELLDATATSLADYDGLDDVITAYRAETIRIWSADGGGTSQPSMELPEKLQGLVRSRKEATELWSAAKAAHASLIEDRVKAQRDFEATTRAVDAAVDQIMIVDAHAVSEELERQQAFVDALRFRLRAFLKIQRPNPSFNPGDAISLSSAYR